MSDDLRHVLFKPFRLPARVSAIDRTRSASKRQGGGTFTATGEAAPESERYVYNPDPTVTKTRKGASREEYGRALRELHRSDRRIRTGERFVGTYVDEKGTTHFDPSVASNDRDTAVRSAQAADQHSIWDRHDKKEIVVCTHGKKCRHMGGG